MADDLEIDLARMSLWTEFMARSYFESGGEEPAVDPEILAAAERDHFKARMEKEELGHLWEVLSKADASIAKLVELIRNRPASGPRARCRWPSRGTWGRGGGERRYENKRIKTKAK